MNKRFDVFLSHNSKDKPAVRELAEALRARGLKVWLDEWELVPGQPWQEALEEIIETTRSSAVLVGKDGFGPWQDAEMRGCLAEFVERKQPVIPVLLPGAPAEPKLPLFLRRFTWVDLRSGLTEEGIDRLQWGATGKRPHRSRLPSTPTAGPEAATVAAGCANQVFLDKPLELRNLPRTTPTIRVQVTLAMEFSSYDDKVESLLLKGLAVFLGISPEEIKVCSVEEGSVKLVVELPVAAAERLLEAGKSYLIQLEGYLDSLGEIRVSADTKASKFYRFSTGGAGSIANLADLRAQAWSEYATALRVSGRLHEAEEAFAKAQEYCEKGTGDPPIRADLFLGLASLRIFQRRFDEAIMLAAEASRIYSELGKSSLVARSRVQKAMAQSYAGEADAAVRNLNRAIPLIDNEDDPHLLLSACHNLIHAYIDLGEPEQALSLLFDVRVLYQEVQDPLMACRADLQEGKILLDLGHLHAAEEALLRARYGFMERDLSFEVALALLDLSEVYLQLGEIEKLHEAVAEMVPIFKSLGVDREVLAALLQLQKADQQSREALELIRFLISRVQELSSLKALK
ncbi:MAG TPA: toll/interleukin-1 receptor domain-containing protein [Thermoanaerobaculia bacterium]|nr:toll/interleukin-1 receptor domain-containing protein [Thermoanaerobaculia bacterium]